MRTGCAENLDIGPEIRRQRDHSLAMLRIECQDRRSHGVVGHHIGGEFQRQIRLDNLAGHPMADIDPRRLEAAGSVGMQRGGQFRRLAGSKLLPADHHSSAAASRLDGKNLHVRTRIIP